MTYTVIIKRSAQKQIEKLPVHIIKKVKTVILALAQNPRPAGCLKLTGSDNVYRLRRAIIGLFMKLLIKF
jgi:mRNA interferase RelE/StbE